MTAVRLADIAAVIRSKNAGPYELTLDVIFADREWYRRVQRAGVLDRTLVARLYQVSEDDVLGVLWVEPATAVKINLRRPLVAGDLGETDVYGAQQHAPLLELTLELPADPQEPAGPQHRAG